MAGAGYKLFNTGDVLTAAQVNTYLMEQSVMVFADAAARTTALSGVVAEGMLSYLKDTNAVEVYDGANWVASDDPNAIQNTIVDAKGDLIAASAADTPARLAVGANNLVVMADSTTATGLKYGGNLQSYTPVWTSSGTAPSAGNSTMSGSFVQVGNQVTFAMAISFGSTATFGTGEYYFSLPVVMGSSARGFTGYAILLDAGVSFFRGFFPESVPNGFTDKFVLRDLAGVPVQETSPFTFVATDAIYVWGTYLV